MTADELFEKGIALLSDNNPLAALAYLEKSLYYKKSACHPVISGNVHSP